MNDNRWAVAVGYKFGFIPVDELEGVILDDNGAIRFEGENYNLYKAKTYEDSRKIDLLLDKYGEYAIKDYKIEPVIMSGEFEILAPNIDKDKDYVHFGAYVFECDGKEIPVDYSGTAWDIKQDGDKITVSFETGRTSYLTDVFIDDCYEDNYKELGLRLNNITAEFLSAASKILEFNVSVEMDEFNGEEYGPENIYEIGGKFTLKSLCFSDGVKVYSVKDEVLRTYNKNLKPVINHVLKPDDAYFDKYDYLCHITDHPVVFSAELPDNMERAIDNEFAELFNKRLHVKCCDYGCDIYPNGITKNIDGKGQYTFQQKVWDFIEQMEKEFDCKCNYFEGYNGFSFDLEFGSGDNTGCYSFGAGNNGQEYSQVLYLKDYKQIRNPEIVKALTYIDSNIFKLLEDNDLRISRREINKSLDNKIYVAKGKKSYSQDKIDKHIEPSR